MVKDFCTVVIDSKANISYSWVTLVEEFLRLHSNRSHSPLKGKQLTSHELTGSELLKAETQTQTPTLSTILVLGVQQPTIPTESTLTKALAY